MENGTASSTITHVATDLKLMYSNKKITSRVSGTT